MVQFISNVVTANSSINNDRYFSNSLDTLPANEMATFLQQMNVQSYYGKPVDSFLAAIPANFYNMKIYPTQNSKGGNCKASYMSINFSPNIYGMGVNIYVTEFTHMNRRSSNCTWDVLLFRKEKIDRIDVYKNQNECINGACMQ